MCRGDSRDELRQKYLGDSELHEKTWGREIKDAKGRNGKGNY